MIDFGIGIKENTGKGLADGRGCKNGVGYGTRPCWYPVSEERLGNGYGHGSSRGNGYKEGIGYGEGAGRGSGLDNGRGAGGGTPDD